MNQGPVLLPGPRLLLSYTEKMGQITATTEDMSGINGTCIVATHWSQLALTILLLSTATQLWDGMAIDKLIPSMHVMSYFSA